MFELAVTNRVEMKNTPDGGPKFEMIKRGNIRLFLVPDHSATHFSHKLKEKIFPTLRECDHLLCEGSSVTQKRLFETTTHSYEQFVVKTFKDKFNHPSDIYPLENGCNNFELANRYELDKNELGTYFLLHQYVSPIITAKDSEAVHRAIEEGMKRLRIQDDFSSLDESKIKKNLLNIYNNKKFLPASIDDEALIKILQIASAIGIMYMGFLREFEFIGPNIKRYIKELPGIKGILIGKAHLPAVEKALENVEFKEPIKWETFIEKFEPFRKSILQTTRSLMSLEHLAGF